MTRIWIGVTAIGTVALVVAQLLDIPYVAPVAKLSASTGFILTAVSVGALRWLYGRVLLVGLFFSWWGDAFLLGSSDSAFLAGLVSFLLAHVLYCVAFGLYGVQARGVLTGAIPVALVSAGATVWLHPHVGDDMRIPVWIYTAVISVMVALAAGARAAGAPLLVPIGAALFYFSDLSVAAGQFVQPAFPNYVWGLPFYFGGQICLALSTRREATGESSPPH